MSNLFSYQGVINLQAGLEAQTPENQFDSALEAINDAIKFGGKTEEKYYIQQCIIAYHVDLVLRKCGKQKAYLQAAMVSALRI